MKPKKSNVAPLSPDFQKLSREALNLGQSDLARRSGVKRVRICLYELGDIQLTPEEHSKIAEALRAEASKFQAIAETLDKAPPAQPSTGVIA